MSPVLFGEIKCDAHGGPEQEGCCPRDPSAPGYSALREVIT